MVEGEGRGRYHSSPCLLLLKINHPTPNKCNEIFIICWHQNRQKQSGRTKGSRNNVSPGVSQKLGEATLSCAAGLNE